MRATTGPTTQPVVAYPAGLVHQRTVLFIIVVLLVGAGLLSIVTDLSLSEAATASTRAVASAPAVQSAGPAPPPTAPESSAMPADQRQVISPLFTPEVQYWAPKIQVWSMRHALDPDIIATIMQIESCGDPSATSYAGAQGLFQVMPFHFESGEDMLDPDTNANRGLAFYNRQLAYTGWDIYLSFAGYNGGYAASGNSYDTWANETQRYYTWAKGIYDDAKAGLDGSPTLRQWLDAGGRGGCQRAAQRLGI